MILRRLQTQSNKSDVLLKRCLENQKIEHNSVRSKTFAQWWHKIWRPFDVEKVKPPYNHCTQIGDPILRNRAAEVPVEMINSDEIKKLVDQMKKVLRNYSLVGLAAPQIGVPSRVIVMEASERLLEKYPKNVYETRQMSILPLTTVINPVLKVKNFNIKMFPEGCASVCGYVGDVKRYEEVLLSGLNENGDAIEIHLKGWSARIAQHECDHLNGQVFVDIMEKKSLSCGVWEAVNVNSGQLHIPFYPVKQKFKVNLNPAKKSIIT